MFMKLSNVNQGAFGVCLILLLMALPSQAKIFKWVDAKGQTHYSENEEDAGKAKTEQLKVPTPPPATQAASSPPLSWQEKARQQRKQRQAQMPDVKPFEPPVFQRPQPLSDGKSDSTDASRCNLARDVLSGAVRHRNGAVTDKNDKEIAESDVRNFCH